MFQKLRWEGIRTDRETVRLCIRSLDPEGVGSRTSHRFRRRIYVSDGPDFLWHLDGYDKLKPFGFAIHGAVDGFIRKLLWLNVAISNNNPKIISYYYTTCIKELKFVPRCVY